MTKPISICSQPGGVRELWKAPELDGLGLAWLGQAGFAFRYLGLRIFLDPYLSDCLEKKYRGTERPHARLMRAPIDLEKIERLDLVICTHRHSDHMDPEALPTLALSHPTCRFIIPKASREHALKLGVPARQIPYMIPHHFGMFAFNTIDWEMVKASAAKIASPSCLLPDIDTLWTVK